MGCGRKEKYHEWLWPPNKKAGKEKGRPGCELGGQTTHARYVSQTQSPHRRGSITPPNILAARREPRTRATRRFIVAGYHAVQLSSPWLRVEWVSVMTRCGRESGALWQVAGGSGHRPGCAYCAPPAV